VDSELELRTLATIWVGGITEFERVESLIEDAFVTEIGRMLWTVTRLEAAEGDVGISGIANRLHESGELLTRFGIGSLVDVYGMAVGSDALKGAQTLAEKARRRRALALAEKISRTIEAGDTPSAADIDELRQVTSPSASAATGIVGLRPVAEYAGAGVQYVYPGVWAEATVNVLSGDPGCGKSTLAAYMADCVAQYRKVLYLDRENSAPIVAERHARMGIKDGGNFLVWGGWCEREAPGPDSPELRAFVEANNPKPLIIVDSLAAFAGGVDENDAGQVRAFMQHFRRLADMGACVVVLHHSGKGENTKDYRGSSDIKAAIDSGWHLSNLGDGGRLERLRLRPWKCRYAAASEMTLSYFDGRFTTESYTPIRTVGEQLTDLLRANPGIVAKDFERLAVEAKLGRQRARDFLKNGCEAKSIRSDPGPDNRRQYHWQGGSDGDI
jgi:hypothetical protein